METKINERLKGLFCFILVLGILFVVIPGSDSEIRIVGIVMSIVSAFAIFITTLFANMNRTNDLLEKILEYLENEKDKN